MIKSKLSMSYILSLIGQSSLELNRYFLLLDFLVTIFDEKLFFSITPQCKNHEGPNSNAKGKYKIEDI